MEEIKFCLINIIIFNKNLSYNSDYIIQYENNYNATQFKNPKSIL